MRKERKFRVGLVSFTDPRATALSKEREKYIEKKHLELVNYLETQGFAAIDALAKLRVNWSEIFGINSTREAELCADMLKAEKADGLIIGCWHWTDPMLAVHLVKQVNLPTVLYTEDDPAWAGATCVTAIGASLWETAPNSHALTHKRIRGDKEALLRWIKGVAASERLKRTTMLLWGGTYSLRMEHLQDDIPKLKSFLIGDILQEDQYMLIKRADAILREKNRVKNFIDWLKENKAKLIYDDKMLTPEALERQIALYFAAKDRLKELENENIAGVSIKCQPEIFSEYGVTACFLPAFLPYPSDSEGEKDIIPCVCEGDIKGLITSVLLNLIEPEIPTLFGDINYLSKDYFFLANCGAASIYYANYSLNPAQALPEVTIEGQCHGGSGGAVSFKTKPGKLTLARLTRIKGEYSMQLGVGEVIPITEKMSKNILWAKMWPRTAIDLGIDHRLFLEITGSNHLSGLPGDYSQEITYACRESGIPIVRIDSEEEIQQALKEKM